MCQTIIKWTKSYWTVDSKALSWRCQQFLHYVIVSYKRPRCVTSQCLLMMWQKTEATRWNLRCSETNCQIQQNVVVSEFRWTMTRKTQPKQPRRSSKQKGGIFFTWPQLNWAAFHLLKTKLQSERRRNKLKNCSSKGLAEHQTGGKPASGDVHEFNGFSTKY